MKILIIASYNKNRFAPFVMEQGDTLQQVGCEVEWFGVQGKGIGGYIKEIPRLRKKICQFKPDVIHAHYGLSCLLANLATRRVPVVSTYHGSDINMPKVRPFSKIAMRLSAWNIFVSKRSMELVGAEEGKKCSLIPCGVALSEDQLQTKEEARAALGWSMEKKKVLFAGAFDNAVKDSMLAKRAIDDLRFKIADLELLELKGYTREEVNRLMCAVDSLLMTSKTEGSPQVIKEAMACGCPIVSVDVGDVAERIGKMEGHIIVPSRDPQKIAIAIEKVLHFEGKTNGRQRILEYNLSSDQIAERIIRIYNEILA